jgi:hypothetical protein
MILTQVDSFASSCENSPGVSSIGAVEEVFLQEDNDSCAALSVELLGGEHDGAVVLGLLL